MTGSRAFSPVETAARRKASADSADQAGLRGESADLEPDLGSLAVCADAREHRDRAAIPLLGVLALANAPCDLPEQGQSIDADDGQVGLRPFHDRDGCNASLVDGTLEVQRLRLREVVPRSVGGAAELQSNSTSAIFS